MAMPQDLSTVYEPHAVEDHWIQRWIDSGVFSPDAGIVEKPYAIVIPPPNVTGSLHMGHALNNTLQDIMIRYHRMKGDRTLWVVGTDHAGIATQNVVERQLDQEGKTRFDLGREAFVKRVWEWKQESGGTILNQLKRLGASCDYADERFTMDEGLSHAVLKVFVDLYKQGLIYRAQRLVNWDPKLHTAISDLEVQQKEGKGHLWYIRYPLVEDPARFVVVATTRPETLFGDTAVAVHPEDQRYQGIIGQQVLLPLQNKPIPVIADDHADPQHGSGAVKITPAHDFNDFEVGRRHNLPLVNIFDPNGCLNDQVPQEYRGLERFLARDRVLKALDTLELIEKTEAIKHTLPHGDRSGVIIEPYLTDQWFVKTAPLAAPAIEAVRSGRTRFVPQHWEKTYFNWMEHIQDWCISRQIWWGHQIPAWYGPDGTIFVEMTEAEAEASATTHYGKQVELQRDTDVLDTWFSSALWPFSTLGWPESTDRLQTFYPTSVLVTGFDIIFFWVARMMMMGLHFMHEVPFKDIHIHALVRDPMGQKMSKSKGNVVDPLLMMKKYGTDAFRFTLAAFAAQGRDIKLDEARIEGYRNFCNKIWNASRFALMNAAPHITSEPDFIKVSPQHRINQWIMAELNAVIEPIINGIESYNFNRAASHIYNFFWSDFCSWYLELTKEIYGSGDQALVRETAQTTFYVLDVSLRLLHPIMPFITEEIWQMMADRKEKMIVRAAYPESISLSPSFEVSKREIELLIEIVTAVRTIRQETGVALTQMVHLIVQAENTQQSLLKEIEQLVQKLGRVSQMTLTTEEPTQPCAVARAGQNTVYIPIQGIIDRDKELARLKKKQQKCERDLNLLQEKLHDPKFTEHAPIGLISEKRQQVTETKAELALIAKALGLL